MKLDIIKILQLMPHRYPILLVDRVLELEPGVRISAIKNVSVNEPFFQGHFPGHPVMPGVLMIEALAQAAAVLTYVTMKTSYPEGDLVPLCRHRWRPLQATGRAGRSASPGRHDGPYQARGRQVHLSRAGRRRACV